MKIALISFEYPPDTAYGGIGTYVHQAAHVMQRLGHSVEVFAPSSKREGTFVDDGVVVHLIKEGQREFFHLEIGPLVASRHRAIGFDVMESPEFFFDALTASELAPDLALVVKLHTPNLLISELKSPYKDSLREDFLSYHPQIKSILRSIRRGWEVPKFHLRGLRKKRIQEIDASERKLTLKADVVLSPSTDLLKRQIEGWGLDPKKCEVLPYAYQPTPELLSLRPSAENRCITFMGRLEERKGIIPLVEALPEVLKRFPYWRVCFAGRSLRVLGMSARNYIRSKLKGYATRVEFTGPYSLSDVPEIVGRSGICVFPSIWENFPNVCLEAMSGARAVIGSSAGGMAEMITDGVNGRLVPSRDPLAITKTLIELIEQPDLRLQLGMAARESILARYSQAVIGPAMERAYQKAIETKKLAIKARSLIEW